MCKNTDLILMMMVHILYVAYDTTSNKNVPFPPSLSCIFDKSYIAALLPDNQTTMLGYYNYYNLSSRCSITKTFETILGHM